MNARRLTGIGIAVGIVGVIMLLMGAVWPQISTFVNYIWVVFACAMVILVVVSYLPRRVVGLLTRLCIAGIMLGIVGMIQPFTFALFKPGFLLLLGSTVLYTILSYIPQPSSASANRDVLVDMPEVLTARGQDM